MFVFRSFNLKIHVRLSLIYFSTPHFPLQWCEILEFKLKVILLKVLPHFPYIINGYLAVKCVKIYLLRPILCYLNQLITFKFSILNVLFHEDYLSANFKAAAPYWIWFKRDVQPQFKRFSAHFSIRRFKVPVHVFASRAQIFKVLTYICLK